MKVSHWPCLENALVAFEPAWLTATVGGLARAIEADAAFDRLPILADALQDAGCEDAAVLAHCRDGGPHAAGCWVVRAALARRDEPIIPLVPAPRPVADGGAPSRVETRWAWAFALTLLGALAAVAVRQPADRPVAEPRAVRTEVAPPPREAADPPPAEPPPAPVERTPPPAVPSSWQRPAPVLQAAPPAPPPPRRAFGRLFRLGRR